MVRIFLQDRRSIRLLRPESPATRGCRPCNCASKISTHSPVIAVTATAAPTRTRSVGRHRQNLYRWRGHHEPCSSDYSQILREEDLHGHRLAAVFLTGSMRKPVI